MMVVEKNVDLAIVTHVRVYEQGWPRAKYSWGIDVNIVLLKIRQG